MYLTSFQNVYPSRYHSKASVGCDAVTSEQAFRTNTTFAGDSDWRVRANVNMDLGHRRPSDETVVNHHHSVSSMAGRALHGYNVLALLRADTLILDTTP